MKELESFKRIGVTPHRSYYIPFAENDVVKTRYGIVDRTKSSRFTSLNGVWYIKQHAHLDLVNIEEELEQMIPVPSCVQMHGFDQIQYINTRYPFPVMLPHIPYENPCWHYRREFEVKKVAKENQVKVDVKQSNYEGELVTLIQKARNRYDGIIINAGAYTHTSIAILDALKSSSLLTVEVHLTDISSREDFRKLSYVSMHAEKQIVGKGFDGYKEAIEYFAQRF